MSREWGANDPRGCESSSSNQSGRKWDTNNPSDEKGCGRSSLEIHRPQSSRVFQAFKNNDMVILPQPPNELQSTPFIERVFGHKSVISVFENPSNQLKGYLIRGKLVVKQADSDSKISDTFVSFADRQHSDSLIIENINFSHGCLLIPAPDFSQIVLLKNLSGVRKKEIETENLLKYQIIHQLSDINERIVGSVDEKLLINVLLNVKQSVKLNTNSITQKLSSYFAKTSEFPKLKIFFKSISEKDLCGELRKIQNCRNVSNFYLHNFIQQMKEEKGVFVLKKGQFICFNRHGCKLTDFEDVFKMVDFYLSPINTNPIETIPHFDAIKSGMLAGATEDAVVDYTKFAKPEGEVMHFRNLVARLQDEPFANGIFLHNITESKVLQILEPLSQHVTLDQFEFDWTYAGNSGIFPFEISYPEIPEQPIRCVANKLNQAVEKYLPFSDLVILSLFNAMPIEFFQDTEKDKNLQHFLKEKLKIIVGIPLLQISNLQDEHVWNQILNAVGKRQKYYLSSCSQPKVLLLFEDYPNLYYIDNNLKLQAYEQNLAQVLFTPVTAEETERMKFIQRFLTLSCLNLHCELTEQRREFCSVEERLWNSDESVDSKQSLSKNGCLNFFISPQQQKILRMNKQFVVLAGQPGCGKTSLLLSKAEKEAENDDIDWIYFLTPKDKVPFIKYIEETVSSFGSANLKQKFTMGILPESRQKSANEDMRISQ